MGNTREWDLERIDMSDIRPYWPLNIWPFVWPLSRVTTLPDIFFEGMSEGQILNEIARRMNELWRVYSSLMTKEEFDLWLQTYVKDQNEQTNYLRVYTDAAIKALREELIALIHEITLGQINVLDPSTGFYSGLEEALSHQYNDERYFAATWDEIEAITSTMDWDEWEAECSLYTVKELDLLFAYLFGISDSPRAMTLPQDYLD